MRTNKTTGSEMIKILKLVTGEEIIGQLKYSETKIEVTRPCAVMLISSKSTPDQHSMALIPYAGYAKDHTITVDERAVIWEAELEDSVYNQYQSIFNQCQPIVGMSRLSIKDVSHSEKKEKRHLSLHGGILQLKILMNTC